jgi:cell cycle checkpoint protein
MAFLEKSLFTSYHFKIPNSESNDPQDEEFESDAPTFSISLPSLLETLQLFNLTDTKSQNPFHRDIYTTPAAFSHSVLGFPTGTCRLQYSTPGAPFTITLEESGITTTCDLTTYEPNFTTDIPFHRDKLALKIIMRATYLHDAITELSAQNPPRLTLTATKDAITLSTSSDLGSAEVEFQRSPPMPSSHMLRHQTPTVANSGNDTEEQESRPKGDGGVLETFLVPSPFRQDYKFAHVAAAKRAMAAATKVSIRADEQGVMSLQFMIEHEEGVGGDRGVSFVDFRLVPLISEESMEEGDSPDSD